MYLTERQYNVLEFLKDFRRAKGFSPTLEEVAQHFGVSKITIHEHVRALEQKGAITREKHRARSIEIPDEETASKPLVLPLRGTIRAGSPLEAIEDDDVLDFSALVSTPRPCFVLKVQGDSMIEDHICDGDLVLVEQRRTARNGETVVALLEDGEATLKRYYKETGRIRLQPANSEMEPIYARQVRIQGVVIGVLRRF